MTTELRRAFDAARAGSEERSYIFGLLGKPDGTVAVSGQPGYLYVRISNEADRTLTTARNPYAVPQRAGLPVKMRRERDQLVIVSIDASRMYDATTTGDTVNPYGVAKHTHLIGSGLEYLVEALRMEPGQLYPAGGLTVGVRSFRYYSAGAWDTFEGDTISLGPYRPATVGHHAWVLVGVDPASNTIVAVAGTSQVYATPLTISQIDSITFTGYIPVGAVKVRNDDTAVTDITKYQDARGWLRSSTTNDADTLDGLNSTAFLILAGQAGGQIARGGTAANEDLTLEGTSHATKTSSYVILQPTAGNVGIGTTAPAINLHLNTNGQGMYLGDSTNIAHGMTARVPTDVLARLVSRNTAAGGLYMEGLSDGDVTGLSLVGTIGATDPTDTIAGVLLVGQKKNTTDAQALGNAETVLAVDNLSTRLFVLMGNGYTGIGTVAPQINLHLNTNGAGMYFGDSTNIAHGMTARVPTDVVARLVSRSTSSGGLFLEGLTDADAIALTLAGTIGSTDPADTTPAILLVGQKKNTTDAQALADAETLLAVDNLSTRRFAILGNGYVGMGTATPDAHLVVSAPTLTVMSLQSTGTVGATRSLLQLINPASSGTGWDFGYNIDTTSQSFSIRELSAGTPTYIFILTKTTKNLGFNTQTQFGSGQGVIGIANATANPSTNPTGGGVLYADAGAGKWRGSGGTVSTFGPAEPHCPVCGSDYAVEFDNPVFGYFSMCLRCLADSLGAQPWITRDKSRLS